MMQPSGTIPQNNVIVFPILVGSNVCVFFFMFAYSKDNLAKSRQFVIKTKHHFVLCVTALNYISPHQHGSLLGTEKVYKKKINKTTDLNES